MPTTLYGTPLDDLIFGGIQDNQLFTDVMIFAGDGNDTIFGSVGDDIIYSGDGADVVFSGIGADVINLESGDDTLRLGVGGENVVSGGGGNDAVIHYHSPSVEVDTVEFDLITGEQTFNGGQLPGNQLTDFENYTFVGSADAFILGNALGNLITVDAGVDWLNGRGGNDVLSAGDGDDTVIGGEGSDLIRGGYGHDILVGDDISSIPSEYEFLF